MVESSGAVVSELERCVARLQSAIEQAPDGAAAPDDQLAAENAVAAGIAVLASEPLPPPTSTPSGRPTAAKDLLITVDLVLRALQAQPDPL